MPWYSLMSTTSFNIKAIAKRHPRLFWGASLCLAGLLYLKVWLPLFKIGVPCVFHEVTGFFCPGCGITRAVLALLELDFIQAFTYNPLVFILIPSYTIYLITKKMKVERVSNSIMITMLVLTVAFGVLRNFPTFDFLAPI